MINIPIVKLGIVAVSRDCFPVQLSEERREMVVHECKSKGINIFEVKTAVENEKDVLKALEELEGAGVNALVVYLGNFVPELARNDSGTKVWRPSYVCCSSRRGRSQSDKRSWRCILWYAESSYNLCPKLGAFAGDHLITRQFYRNFIF